MVDVSAKGATLRTAIASGCVRVGTRVMKKIRAQEIAKGSVTITARLAGIMAAKAAPTLIPLCHPLRLDAIDVRIEAKDEERMEVTAVVAARETTGVEMEALTAVAVACLTIYDMCKGLDKGMVIEQIALIEKKGGRSGTWTRGPKGTRR
jgi:cyclic pyranopterin monophosphate synthase